MDKSFSTQIPKTDPHRTIRDTNERARETFTIRRVPSRSIIKNPAIARRPTRSTVSLHRGAEVTKES